MEQNFFPQRPSITPTIYAYRLPGVDSHRGYLKVGYTDRTAKERIDEQLHTSKIASLLSTKNCGRLKIK